ncbi:hypothetical protein BDR03DRAFT_105415 [Suillus americanus]|nr:hypothetical protein BDR03DRAFT_105415 [Suillus americanus]
MDRSMATYMPLAHLQRYFVSRILFRWSLFFMQSVLSLALFVLSQSVSVSGCYALRPASSLLCASDVSNRFHGPESSLQMAAFMYKSPLMKHCALDINDRLPLSVLDNVAEYVLYYDLLYHPEAHPEAHPAVFATALRFCTWLQ